MTDPVLSREEILRNIEIGQCFEAYTPDRSLYIKLEKIEPYACFAIHHGHQLRPSLRRLIALNDHERKYEEDPLTGDLISSFPMVVIAQDSRYEYDLNRDEAGCIYDVAWGKTVWRSPVSDEEREISLNKHRFFFRLVDALLALMKNRYGNALIYDIHSYNYQRYNEEYPVFNLGTGSINRKRFSGSIRNWLTELSRIELPNLETSVGENTLFKGNGYFLKYVTKSFPDALVFATEIKKVYMDEASGEVFPMVMEALKNGLKTAIINNVSYYIRNNTKLKSISPGKLLSDEIRPELKTLDQELFRLVKNFEILNFVNPVNIEQEKKKFFKSGYRYEPSFRYSQLAVDPFSFRRKLYELPVDRIQDVSLQKLYKDVINSYADKVDIINSIGTERFLYNTLRYYGEPDHTDIENAEYVLALPNFSSNEDEGDLVFNSSEAAEFFREKMKAYGFQCKIELSSKIIARAIVINHKQLLIIKKDALFSRQTLEALFHHEIGVHMLTTMNSLEQPLRILNIGFPLNDLTQEGLAILSEYFSGNIDLRRMKELAIRVKATKFMVKGYSFSKVFRLVTEEYKLEHDHAFYLTSRIFRGGGFTKDYLYLKGFRDLFRYQLADNDLSPLLIGKVSLPYVDVIKEMIDRGIMRGPKYQTLSFKNPETLDPILQYIISGIK
ncbi:MAG: flavohemoglobin expression-modulating QEGLA motif protein [Bacteroidetes bacterium]|nr:flavohemoglobin expression-modulating QEGLA motif protein [Bacteroidota bacterium]